MCLIPHAKNFLTENAAKSFSHSQNIANAQTEERFRLQLLLLGNLIWLWGTSASSRHIFKYEVTLFNLLKFYCSMRNVCPATSESVN